MLRPHADAFDGFFEGYGVHLYPDGRWGHGGGDPGVAVIVNRWPGDDLQVVVLGNTAGPVGEVRDLCRASSPPLRSSVCPANPVFRDRAYSAMIVSTYAI